MKKKQRRAFKMDIEFGKDVIAREVKIEDVAFITNSWLKSNRDSEFTVAVPNDIYYENHGGLVKLILMQDSNAVTVLCDPEDPDHIMGYVVYNTKYPIIFYMYIKHAFRGLGLGRYLFESIRKNFGHNVRIHCTHKLRGWKKFKSLGLVFNPYLVREPEGCQESAKSDSTKEL